MIDTIGLPVMHKEEGEKRAFLPSFVERLSKYDVEVYIEKGYGKKIGYTEDDYKNANEKVKFVTNKEVYQKDLVIVLRAPNDNELDYMKEESCLLSMLHYDSRPELEQKIVEKKINSFSLDSIANDDQERMVVTFELTAWGGVHTALSEMKRRRADFFSADRSPYRVVILGMGNLGTSAGRSCFRYIDKNITKKYKNKMIPGIVLNYIEKDSLYTKDEQKKLFVNTDLLIDATKRADFTKYIVSNNLVGCLKEDAIILDLTADHYDESTNPIQVKAIEGLPYGTLDDYVIEVDSKKYDDIPDEVNTDFRRVTVSCNGWPGVFPVEAMKTYEKQLDPFVEILVNKGTDLSLDSKDRYERALYRATTKYFEEYQKNTLRNCDEGGELIE